MLTYISNTDHYNLVLSRVASVRKSQWIGTADIKDLYVKVGDGTVVNACGGSIAGIR